jgi:hypothetical protein
MSKRGLYGSRLCIFVRLFFGFSSGSVSYLGSHLLEAVKKSPQIQRTSRVWILRMHTGTYSQRCKFTQHVVLYVIAIILSSYMLAVKKSSQVQSNSRVPV